jgi:hypothetical protein
MDYGKGLCTLKSPKAQGVTGFLNRNPSFDLGNIQIQSTDKYATVLVVAMDDNPLKESRKILVQVGTTERPSGWKTKPAEVGGRAGEEVVDFGHAPWMISHSHVTISIANQKLSKAVILDPNGMRVKEVALENAEGGKRFHFPDDALYAVVE